MLLASLNWSARAAQFFLNVNIETIEQITEKSPQEILKYRNVGKKTLTEIRFKLGKAGLHLQDDKAFSISNFDGEYEQLVQKKMSLELELASVINQIEEIREAKMLEKADVQPINEEVVYTAWKAGTNFSRLAKEFKTRPEAISEICWSRLEADCQAGNPPIIPHKLERHSCCKSCNSPMVFRYQNELRFPKCPSCGRTSKNYFK